MHEMELLGVRVEMPSNAPMVLLRERAGSGRTVQIFVGAAEATAIALALDGVETPRPMTHDLLAEVLGSLDVELSAVVVTELRDKTFFAELHLRRQGQGGEPIVVSARPSDAVAVAVRTGTSIYAAEEVIAEAGYTENADSDGPEEVVEEFKEFLDTISPEDFDD